MEELVTGDFVKIKLIDDEGYSETFWCKVKEIKNGKIIGTVDNDLVLLDYPCGHELTIKPSDVLQVLDKDTVI